jgi:hypothetical protein
MLNVHPDRAGDLITPDTMTIDPPVPAHTFVDSCCTASGA